MESLVEISLLVSRICHKVDDRDRTDVLSESVIKFSNANPINDSEQLVRIYRKTRGIASDDWLKNSKIEIARGKSSLKLSLIYYKASEMLKNKKRRKEYEIAVSELYYKLLLAFVAAGCEVERATLLSWKELSGIESSESSELTESSESSELTESEVETEEKPEVVLKKMIDNGGINITNFISLLTPQLENGVMEMTEDDDLPEGMEMTEEAKKITDKRSKTAQNLFSFGRII